MGWADFGKGLLNVGENVFYGPAGKQQMDQRAQAAQNADIDAKQQQAEADLKFHQHMNDMGALPVVNGVVKRPISIQGDPTMGVPSFEGPVMDKVDKSRFIPHPTDKGAGWELPTPEEQIVTQAKRHLQSVQAGGPAADIERQRAAESAQSTAQATTLGAAAGKTAGEQADLDKRGVPLTPDEQSEMGLPASQTSILPEQSAQLAGRITPANLRANASMTNSERRAEVQKALSDQRINQLNEQLQHKDAWERLRADTSQANNAATIAGANGRNASRINAGARLSVDQRLHEAALNQAYAEEQKQMSGMALLDTMHSKNWLGQDTSEPAVQDGEEFTDPWSGKKMTMNAAQRTRLQNALTASQAQSKDLRGRAQAISDKYGLDKYMAPEGGAPTAQPNAATAGTPGAPTAPPSATRGGAPATHGAAPATGRPPSGPSAPGRPQQQGDKVRIRTSDGRTGLIPRANLAAAQKQFGAQVIP